MVNLQFPLVETLWKTFWRFSENQAGDAALAVYVCFFTIDSLRLDLTEKKIEKIRKIFNLSQARRVGEATAQIMSGSAL